MSRVTKHRCEKCGNETENIPATSGWIVIADDDMRSGYKTVSIEVTTTVNGPNCSNMREQAQRFDFCSTTCLVNWIGIKTDAAVERNRKYLAEREAEAKAKAKQDGVH